MNNTGDKVLFEKLQRRGLWALLTAIISGGLYTLVRFVQVNPLRGDEFFSFMHSDFDSVVQVLANVRHGSDNTYIYSAMLWAFVQVFGHSIFVQRMLSLCLWLLAAVLLFKTLKPVFDSLVWRLAAIALILFSSQGIFLATDGRLYALLLFCALWQWMLLLRVLHVRQNLRWWHVTLVPLTGLLTSPVFFVGQLVLGAGLLLLWRAKRDTYLLKQALRFLAGSVLMLLLFFVCFHVGYQHESLLNGYLLQHIFHPQVQGFPGQAFFSIPFRWVMLPHVPGLSPAADGVFFLLFMCGFVLLCRKAFINSLRMAPVAIQLVAAVLACAMGLLGLQLLLYVLAGVPVWSYRYYTSFYFVLPLFVCWLLFRHGATLYASLLVLLFFTGCWFRVVHEAEKITPREVRQQLLQQYAGYIEKSDCAVFAERFSPDAYALGIYGELYIRYPALRPKMVFAANRGAEWAAYFNILNSLNYHSGIRDMATVPLNNACLVLKQPDDRREFAGHRVVELVSPFVGE